MTFCFRCVTAWSPLVGTRVPHAPPVCDDRPMSDDAVLPAERYPLRYELLHEVFRLSGEWPYPYREKILLEHVVEAVGYVEFNHFVTEYPRFRDDEREFAERLVRAVTPTFEGIEP